MQPLVYRAGHGYRYGDDDYELLAAVLEIVGGRSWQEVVRHEVLEPLGLTIVVLSNAGEHEGTTWAS